jgi:hypothetical protein
MTDKIAERMSESNSRVATWTDEDRYWRDSFRTRPYVTGDRDYDFYQPAYRYGFESATKYRGRPWGEVESSLSRGWETAPGHSKSTWQEIKDVVRDAWDRVTDGTDRAAKREMAEHMNPRTNP